MVDFTAVPDAAPIEPQCAARSIASAPGPQSEAVGYDSFAQRSEQNTEIINRYAAAARQVLENPAQYSQEEIARAQQIEQELALLESFSSRTGVPSGLQEPIEANAPTEAPVLSQTTNPQSPIDAISRQLAAYDQAIAAQTASGNATQALLLRYQQYLFEQQAAGAMHAMSLQMQSTMQSMQLTDAQTVAGSSWYGGT